MSVVADAARMISDACGGDVPQKAIVLGSGLGDLADAIEAEAELQFQDLPGFPVPTVKGHGGRMVIGKLGNERIICLQGRAHLYEGHDIDKVTNPVRALKVAGAEHLILTNAAGSLDADMGPGSLMIIEDHINYAGINPLIGPNDESIGPRFPDMSDAWSEETRRELKEVADRIGVKVGSGVYIWVTGPTFETPAEIRAFRTMGATAVGMSTVPECIVATHAGMKVSGISIITNYAAGMQGAVLDHKDTLEQGARGARDLVRLVKAWLGAEEA